MQQGPSVRESQPLGPNPRSLAEDRLLSFKPPGPREPGAASFALSLANINPVGPPPASDPSDSVLAGG